MMCDNTQQVRVCESTPLSVSSSSNGMTPRLYAAASCVRQDSHCVDIGTDHGYLAAYLYKSGISLNVTAADINEKPLEAARRTFIDEGISNHIPLLLSDGLTAINPLHADDIIICGMGGELILKILLTVPFTREVGRRFVLQPMTSIPILRKGLYANGFFIEREIPVLEGKRGYTVIQAGYSGEKKEIDDYFALVGKLVDSSSDNRNAVFKLLMTKEERILSGLLKASVQDVVAIATCKTMLERLNGELDNK